MAPPLPASEGRTLQAIGARRRVPGRPSRGELVSRLRQLGQEGNGLVALFDARGIAGERHLLSAWAHMGRARARGEERLRDRGAELALYVSGDDQLPRALAKIGVSDDSEALVLVFERPRTAESLLELLELEADPTAYPRPPDAALLGRLGLTEIERSAVPPSAWEGLVLERVALIELSTSHAPPRRTQKP
jgi:tRNA threonylcarbamoyladenosine modification (KEOPS) complex Cgi121 subunit